MVELGGRLIVERGPCLCTIEGHTGTTVTAQNDTLRIVRVNPEVVMITVRCGDLSEAASTVIRLKACLIEGPDSLCILWVSINMLIVPAAFAQVALLREP